MNLSEMQDFVRAQADTDVSDAPDAVLSVYARAAYRDIQARVFPWPDKKVAYTLATVPGLFGYPLSGLPGPGDLQFVVSVASQTEVLMYVTPEQMRELRAGSSASGTPTVYTVDFGEIRFWPTPGDVTTFAVSGYRAFRDWPSGSDEPDLPRGFDEPICWYMLARFYQAQEDLELSQTYLRDYETAISQQIGSSLRSSSVTAGPMIFGGDPRLKVGLSYRDWVRRNVEG